MKLVFFGSESSGKTTLALQIAHQFSALYCPEYVREYLALRNQSPHREGIISVYDDIEPMSIGQAALEASFEKSLGLSPQNLLCYDTNIETNYIYSLYYFGKVPSILQELVERKQYDLYLLLYPDTPWEDDGLRDSPHNRLAMHQLFKDYLIERNRNFIEISGDLATRFSVTQEIISTLLHQKS